MLVSPVTAQQRSMYLQVLFEQDRVGKDLQKTIRYQTFFNDSAGLYAELSNVLLRCNEQSFLQAGYTNTVWRQDSFFVYLSHGKSYRWLRIRTTNIPDDLLEGSGSTFKQLQGKPLLPKFFFEKANKLVTYLENNGYPFASVRLDSIEADSETVSASVQLDFNKMIVFDTAEIIGNVNLKKWYLYKYLGIKEESPYNEALITNAQSRLSQLPYVQVSGKPGVYFYGNKALPVFSLDNRKASSIDGIVGFAPNNNTSGNTGRLLVTGELNLKLQNLGGSGKSVDVNYRSFLGNSQDLKIRLVYPYIFRTNLALDYKLDLLKQDSTFLDVRNEFGLQYRFIGNDYMKVFYQIQQTALITVDTSAIKRARALPDASDITTNSYGIGLKVTRFDYFLNPRRGYAIDITGEIGVKRINRNTTIDALVLTAPDGSSYNIYDSVKLRYIQYRFQGNAEKYFPLGNAMTFRLQGIGGHIVAENVFVNELFRIGGIRTLKGFDEQAIFASTYLIANAELRYLLGQNSNVLLFWNGAYYQNKVRTPRLSDTPFGFGAGFNFESGVGVFSIFYAVGKEQNNAINFARAKVHFGYINYF